MSLICLFENVLRHVNLQVAKSVKTVLRANRAIVSVKLDMKRIDALQLDLNSDTVAHAIVGTSKIKLKHVVSVARTLKYKMLFALKFFCMRTISELLSTLFQLMMLTN